MTKGKLKAWLSKKYKGKVAEKILSLFQSEMNVPLDFATWIDLLETLLNQYKERLKWVAFNVFDYNEDKQICQLDMYALMKIYENDDDVFINGYVNDIIKVVETLN